MSGERSLHTPSASLVPPNLGGQFVSGEREQSQRSQKQNHCRDAACCVRRTRQGGRSTQRPYNAEHEQSQANIVGLMMNED